MRQMQGVLWTKGLLLSPQHLQLHDRYFEDQLGFQMGALAKYPWGFGLLTVDPEALEGGVLSVPQASGIMEDGLLFDFPEADPAPDSKTLDEYWKPDQGSMLAYLAIPEYRAGDRNVSSEGTGARARFSAEVSFRRDENTGVAERPVEVARKNLRLLVEGESMEGVNAIGFEVTDGQLSVTHQGRVLEPNPSREGEGWAVYYGYWPDAYVMVRARVVPQPIEVLAELVQINYIQITEGSHEPT